MKQMCSVILNMTAGPFLKLKKCKINTILNIKVSPSQVESITSHNPAREHVREASVVPSRNRRFPSQEYVTCVPTVYALGMLNWALLMFGGAPHKISVIQGNKYEFRYTCTDFQILKDT